MAPNTIAVYRLRVGYLWIKSLHLIAVISWMAGMLYLLRLYVNHAAETEQVVLERFQGMERRLLRAITNPAMIVTLLTGAAMLYIQPDYLKQPFMHMKLTLVFGMLVMHGLAARWRKRLITEPHFRSHRFFRVMNEIPTLLMIGIVICIVVRPFLR
jgi:putative membrane protein